MNELPVTLLVHGKKFFRCLSIPDTISWKWTEAPEGCYYAIDYYLNEDYWALSVSLEDQGQWEGTGDTLYDATAALEESIKKNKEDIEYKRQQVQSQFNTDMKNLDYRAKIEERVREIILEEGSAKTKSKK